jgi:hypothetical protein
MGGMSADCENLVSPADQQNLLAVAMASQHAAIREFGERNPLREIRTMKGLFLRHVTLPCN